MPNEFNAQLIAAAKNADIKNVLKELKKRTVRKNINAVDEGSETVLHNVVYKFLSEQDSTTRKALIKIIVALLNAGANPMLRDGVNNSVYETAIKTNDFSIDLFMFIATTTFKKTLAKIYPDLPKEKQAVLALTCAKIFVTLLKLPIYAFLCDQQKKPKPIELLSLNSDIPLDRIVWAVLARILNIKIKYYGIVIRKNDADQAQDIENATKKISSIYPNTTIFQIKDEDIIGKTSGMAEAQQFDCVSLRNLDLPDQVFTCLIDTVMPTVLRNSCPLIVTSTKELGFTPLEKTKGFQTGFFFRSTKYEGNCANFEGGDQLEQELTGVADTDQNSKDHYGIVLFLSKTKLIAMQAEQSTSEEQQKEQHHNSTQYNY